MALVQNGQYTNVMSGDTATFSIAFMSTANVITVPTSANLTVTYFSSKVSQVTTVSLTVQNSFWTGAWNTTGADLGLATWVVSSPLGLGAAGQINVTQD
jgi:hypothetical protein